jgi:DUF4097 and DUF4098 domain-containing protein YvlB
MRTRAILRMGLAAAIVALCAAPGKPASIKIEETHEKKVELKGEKYLLIANKRGDIKVIGEEGRSDLALTINKYVRAENEARAKRIADEMDVEIIRKGKEILIRAQYPEDRNSRKSIISVILQRDPRARMDFVILAPKAMNVVVKASSGDVEVINIDEDVTVSAASGDVDVVGIAGDIEIGVSSGDISARDVAGSANLNTSSGSVETANIQGDIEVKTSSGDIELGDIGGDLTIVTASGDSKVEGVGSVEYKGASGDAEIYGVRGSVDAAAASGDLFFRIESKGDFSHILRTSSGDIRLRFLMKMPGGYMLKANTTNGDISVDLPIKITKVGRHMISGIVREGKSVVALETVSGSIAIAENEE